VFGSGVKPLITVTPALANGVDTEVACALAPVLLSVVDVGVTASGVLAGDSPV